MTRLRALDDRAVEALLTGVPLPHHDDLVGALTLLAALPAAPPPNPLLARLLSEGLPAEAGMVAVDLREPARPRRRWTAGIGLGIAAVTASLLTAATANALPSPAQRFVSDVVGAVTPFELPAPADTAPAPLPEQLVPAPDQGDGVEVAPRPTDERDEPDDAVPSGAAAERDEDDAVPDPAERDDSGSGDDAPDEDSPDAPDADDEPTERSDERSDVGSEEGSDDSADEGADDSSDESADDGSASDSELDADD